MDDSTPITQKPASPGRSVMLVGVGLFVGLTVLSVGFVETASVPPGVTDDASANTTALSGTEYVESGARGILNDYRVTGDNARVSVPPLIRRSVTVAARRSNTGNGVILESLRSVAGTRYLVAAASSPVSISAIETSEKHTAVPAVEYGFAQADRATDAPWVVEDHDPVARCTVEPTRVQPGESVRISAEGSEGVAADYDLTGDGTWDVRRTDRIVLEVTYSEEGEFTPRVRIWSGDGRVAVAECGTVTVSKDVFGVLPVSGDYVDWAIYAFGLLGVGGLFWWVATHWSTSTTRGKSIQYGTGTFEIPSESGPVAIDSIGFEPDVLLFRAMNRHRSDDATDRTAGLSYGVAIRDESGAQGFTTEADETEQSSDLVSQCVTVADDARRTDRATAASRVSRVLDLIRHGPPEPGRITAQLTETTADGFELDVSVPEDDATAGGARVLYQAFQIGSADAAIGHALTPTEPGTDTLELGIAADHVELVANSAVAIGETDATDRSVGLTVGRAVGDDGTIRSTAGGTSAWPGRTAATAATCYDERVLGLVSNDGDRITGRVSAKPAELGTQLRLEYDQVDVDPKRVEPTRGHALTYLAIDSGGEVRPAIGTFPFPEPGASISLEVGFEPGLIDLEVVGAEPGEERFSAAGTQPFEWSHGTAIQEGNTIVQHVLHPSVAPGRDEATTGRPAVPADSEQGTSVTADGGEAMPEGPEPMEPGGDGIAASWLVQEPTSGIVGRDDLRVDAITETGFAVSVETVSTDRREDTGPRPTVMYRVWPDTGDTAATETESSAGEATTGEQE